MMNKNCNKTLKSYYPNESENIIAFPFAFDCTMNTGINIHNTKNSLSIYLKNICVAAISAKHYNPNCKASLVTNLEPDKLPNYIVRLLNNNNINILFTPFDKFRFDNDYTWSLAFYKLCALSFLIDMKFKKICYLDTDVFVQDSFENIWLESDKHILLYDTNHGLNALGYRQICQEFDDFLHSTEQTYITHYGGEFFCTNLENAKHFLSVCKCQVKMSKNAH